MIRQTTVYCCIQTAIEKFIASDFQWRSRVPRGALERLERHELKSSRVVLRGLEGSNPLRLPGGDATPERVNAPYSTYVSAGLRYTTHSHARAISPN